MNNQSVDATLNDIRLNSLTSLQTNVNRHFIFSDCFNSTSFQFQVFARQLVDNHRGLCS